MIVLAVLAAAWLFYYFGENYYEAYECEGNMLMLHAFFILTITPKLF